MLFDYIFEGKDPMSSQIFTVYCPEAPGGKMAKIVRALGREELLETARDIRWDCKAQCLLLYLPDGERRMAVMDLEAMAEELEPHAQKVVSPCSDRGPYPCGPVPKCREHLPTLEREALVTFNQLLSRAESSNAALESTFKGLSPRDIHLVQRWATASDPERPNRAIRLKILAQEINRSVRQVRRILTKARSRNPIIYKRLLALRKDRARFTRAKPLYAV